MSPLGHLASERSWTSAPKVSGIAHRDFEADRPDPTAIPDENDARASRILFYNENSEDNVPPASGTSTPHTVVGGDKREDGPTGECS